MATAVRLAVRGYQVTVFERNAYPGGKLSEFECEGFRFDAGPSLFTMPQYVDELFELAGEPAGSSFKYLAHPVACHYFWDDGTFFAAPAKAADFALACEQTFGISADRVNKFLEKSARKYALAGRIFLEKSLHKPATWLNAAAAKASLRLPFYDIFSTLHQVHQNWFAQAPKLVQLFDRYATYNGSNPFKAPGMLTIIPHFEYNIGVFYPNGGMHHITQSIFELSQRLGVKYRFSTMVEEINVTDGKSTGVTTANGTFHADGVVSNMDVYFTYKKLLKDLPHPERILKQPKSTSALIFYWGINREFPELDLHNIFFSNDYKQEFNHLEAGRVWGDPTVYINITSKLTPGDAPKGCENWFVMVNVPPAQDLDISSIRNAVIQKVGKRLGVDLASLIQAEEILTPGLIESRTASHLGALYGYSSNTPMAAFLRHPNFSMRIKGLYFVGGSVHPGGGIPLCLLSAKITDDLIAKSLKSQNSLY